MDAQELSSSMFNALSQRSVIDTGISIQQSSIDAGKALFQATVSFLAKGGKDPSAMMAVLMQLSACLDASIKMMGNNHSPSNEIPKTTPQNPSISLGY